MNDMMLIVDDLEMNREVLKALFDTEYEIMEAESGAEALAILERCKSSIDIVLLDLMMDDVSGFDVLKERKELDYFRSIPVVVITSSGQMEDQISAFKLGANDFISKPFVPEIVISRVDNVMSSSRRMLSIELEAQKLKVKSELDEMTGLYNKTTTESTMDAILQSSKDRLEVMMVIDIDNFKTVNDTAGHQMGDYVINIISNLISGLFRKTDIVGRIGGDEFCAMMVDVPDISIAYEKVNELIQIMRYKPNLTIPEYVTLSIGLATNDRKKTTYIDLFNKADEALYQAKQAGKARYQEYGVEAVSQEEDDRAVAMLLSNNRSVCSVIHALIPAHIRIIEALSMEDLTRISKEDIEKTVIIYVDVTDTTDHPDTIWEKLRTFDWFHLDNTFAICKEGDKGQYIAALQSGVADLFMAPIDSDTFKRRTSNHLEKLGIIDTKEK